MEMCRKLVRASIFGLILSVVIANDIIQDEDQMFIHRDRSLDARQNTQHWPLDSNRRMKTVIGLRQSANLVHKSSILPIYDNGLEYANAYPTPILQRDPTVIVNVPNNDMPGYGSVGNRYGTAGNRYGVPVTPYSAGSSPTVVVNVPDNEYDNVYRGGYPRTNIFGNRRI